jgi:hypothetical protein
MLGVNVTYSYAALKNKKESDACKKENVGTNLQNYKKEIPNSYL